MINPRFPSWASGAADVRRPMDARTARAERCRAAADDVDSWAIAGAPSLDNATDGVHMLRAALNLEGFDRAQQACFEAARKLLGAALADLGAPVRHQLDAARMALASDACRCGKTMTPYESKFGACIDCYGRTA